MKFNLQKNSCLWTLFISTFFQTVLTLFHQAKRPSFIAKPVYPPTRGKKITRTLSMEPSFSRFLLSPLSVYFAYIFNKRYSPLDGAQWTIRKESVPPFFIPVRSLYQKKRPHQRYGPKIMHQQLPVAKKPGTGQPRRQKRERSGKSGYFPSFSLYAKCHKIPITNGNLSSFLLRLIRPLHLDYSILSLYPVWARTDTSAKRS